MGIEGLDFLKGEEMIIHIRDDLSATQTPVVKLMCDCSWEDKTFKDGCLSFAVSHFTQKHGGNGRIHYNGQYQDVRNGYLKEAHPAGSGRAFSIDDHPSHPFVD